MLFATLLVAALHASSAHAFGTVDGILGQNTEHERITRLALSCRTGTGQRSSADCFEANTIDNLAGAGGSFGAVGSPDSPVPLGHEAHCDDADFLDVPGYPQSREKATEMLQKCITHLRDRVHEGVDYAAEMMDDGFQLVPEEVDISGTSCTFRIPGGISFPGRAKCHVLEGFGGALHGVQDFYAHSNWADYADPPFNRFNPPGLGRDDISPILDLRSTIPIDSAVPHNLSTGCFALPDTIDGFFACENRITHATLEKDKGVIDRKTGKIEVAGSPRGERYDGLNFQRAVNLAILDTRRQWYNFRNGLKRTYGPGIANRMICAITRDDPKNDCQGRRIAVVLDSSDSNLDAESYRHRVAAVKNLNSHLFSTARVGSAGHPDKVMIVTYDDRPKFVYGLGDPSGVEAALDGLGSIGRASPGEGLRFVIDPLMHGWQQRDIVGKTGVVALTDGLDSVNPGLLRLQLLRAESEGIRVSLGLLSSSSDSTEEVRQRMGRSAPDVDTITAILRTGGLYAVIDSGVAQQNFITLVESHGITNADGTGASINLYRGVKVAALVSHVSKKNYYMYEARAGEKMNFTVDCLAKQDGDMRVSITLRDISHNEKIKEAFGMCGADARISFTASGDQWLEVIVEADPQDLLDGAVLVGVQSSRPVLERQSSPPSSNVHELHRQFPFLGVPRWEAERDDPTVRGEGSMNASDDRHASCNHGELVHEGTGSHSANGTVFEYTCAVSTVTTHSITSHPGKEALTESSTVITSSSISYGPTTITKDDGDVVVTNWPFDVTYTTSADPDTVYEYIHNSSPQLPEENPAEPTSRPTPRPPSSLAGSDTAPPPEIAHSISTPPPARPRNRQHQQQQLVPDSRASLATTSTSTTPASPASLLSNDHSHPVETSTPTKNGARPSQLPLLQFTDSALPRIKSWRSFMAKAVVFIGTWFALA